MTLYQYIACIGTKKNPKCTAGHFVEFFAVNLYRGVIWPKKSIWDDSFSIWHPSSNLATTKSPKRTVLKHRKRSGYDFSHSFSPGRHFCFFSCIFTNDFSSPLNKSTDPKIGKYSTNQVDCKHKTLLTRDCMKCGFLTSYVIISKKRNFLYFFCHLPCGFD